VLITVVVLYFFASVASMLLGSVHYNSYHVPYYILKSVPYVITTDPYYEVHSMGSEMRPRGAFH